MPRKSAKARSGGRGNGGGARASIEFLKWLDDNPTPTSQRRLESTRAASRRQRASQR